MDKITDQRFSWPAHQQRRRFRPGVLDVILIDIFFSLWSVHMSAVLESKREQASLPLCRLAEQIREQWARKTLQAC